ncbi:MAG TPA: hypothetical protein PLW99_00725 [Candidatus Paceibacterota bacterium]|nr:hypothetical protein [Candidatus Paceibacterota bacterium]
MATKAIHPLGERILEEPTPVAFYREEEDTYLGSFLAGLGTIDLRFPKCNCRMLTECEVTALALGKLKSWGQLP